MSVRAIAACSTHLAGLLELVVEAGNTVTVRVSNLEEPDQSYVCECGNLAHWYVRSLEPDTVRQWKTWRVGK